MDVRVPAYLGIVAPQRRTGIHLEPVLLGKRSRRIWRIGDGVQHMIARNAAFQREDDETTDLFVVGNNGIKNRADRGNGAEEAAQCLARE